MKIKPSIVVDTREKKPWFFEEDEEFEYVYYEKLEAGDYSIKGMEDIITIERKATADELLGNFMTNKARIYAEIDRMRDYKLKFIVIEQDLADLLNTKSYYINKKKWNKRSPNMPIAIVMSNLTDLMLLHGVQVIFAGSNAQRISRRLLLRAYELHQKGQL